MARNLAPEIVTGYNANKAAWLEQFALMTRLAAIAKKEGIDQREPYKQQIDYNNMMFLAQAMMDYRAGNAPVTPEVKRAWLDAHKKVAIRIMWSTTGAAPWAVTGVPANTVANPAITGPMAVRVSGLVSGTRYYFQVLSVNAISGTYAAGIVSAIAR